MTYIEFYDKNSIENVCACLAMVPDEVVLVGNKAKAMQRHIDDYKTIFGDRGQEIQFSYKTVSRWKTDQVLTVLEKIIQEKTDCVFGITGGDEMILFALGIIYERHKDKNIQVHRISIQNNAIHDCDMDGKTIDHQTPSLSVEENIRIYGGEVIKRMENGKRTDLWDMNSEFMTDIEDMWSICKKNPRTWNKQIGVFETISEVGTASGDGLTVTASINDVKNYYEKPQNKGSYSINPNLIKELKEKGLLDDVKEEGDIVTLIYKNAQVKKCLTKAGQALEMKIFMTAKELKDESGKLLYNDVRNGVEIDWDGEDANKAEDAEDTERNTPVVNTMNEIDVLLMHDMVPVFISCKNGDVRADELYKLNTVAERFGGKYAKKILVSSVLPKLDNCDSLKQRAEDMQIQVITEHNLMNDDALKNRMKNLWK